MFEFREVKNEAEYNPLLISKDTPFTQAWFFGQWQEMMGRKVRRFEILKNSKTIGFFQAIVYPLVFSKKLIYIPHAPILRQGFGWQAEFLKVLHEKLVEIGKEENTVFIRFDLYSHNPNYGSIENFEKYFRKIPNYAYHSSYFQPKYEWILDLNKTEEELFKAMHPKTRYNIGLAERRGVKVEIVKQDFKKYFDDFYRLVKETAKRDNFNLHPKIYYENIFNTVNAENAFLTIAGYKNKILLVNLILTFGKIAYFLFGGSSNEHKNLMFSYLAQWETIKEVKRRGFEIYNFGAVGSSTLLRVNNFEGISRFKKGFGGRILEYSDSYDLILKPFWYFLYNLRKRYNK